MGVFCSDWQMLNQSSGFCARHTRTASSTHTNWPSSRKQIGELSCSCVSHAESRIEWNNEQGGQTIFFIVYVRTWRQNSWYGRSADRSYQPTLVGDTAPRYGNTEIGTNRSAIWYGIPIFISEQDCSWRLMTAALRVRYLVLCRIILLGWNSCIFQYLSGVW